MYRKVKDFEKVLVFIGHLPLSQCGITHNAVFRETPPLGKGLKNWFYLNIAIEKKIINYSKKFSDYMSEDLDLREVLSIFH